MFKKFLRRREGFSLVESLILILVVAITLGALLQTTALTTELQIKERRNIDSMAVASSWFAALDSVMVASDVPTAIANAIKMTDKYATYISDARYETHDGFITVTATILNDKGKPFTMSRSYNIYGNETVSDDKYT